MKNLALDPSYFKMDERSLSDLMNFVSAFAKQVQYVDLNNEFAGNWTAFFESNLAFILAEIAGFDAEGLEQKFLSISKKLEHLDSRGHKIALMVDLFEANYSLFRLINYWYSKSKKDPEYTKQNELYNELNRVIKSEFKFHLKSFMHLYGAFKTNKAFSFSNEFEFNQFDSIWQIGSIDQSIFTGDSDRNLDADTKSLTQWLRSLSALIIQLKETAEAKLERVLTEYPYHEPHISVVASFLKAFRHVQDDYNQTLKNHLDYYFQHVLHQKHKLPIPDMVHVALDPADHVLRKTIEGGELLIAGTDLDGLNVNYKTDHDLELNRASIAQLKVVHVANNREIGIGKLYKDISNIYSNEILLDEAGWVLGDDLNKTSKFLFGRDQSILNFENRDMAQAELGFAISSSTLLLAEGQRKINLTFKFQLNSLSSLISFVDEVSSTEQITADSALHKILNDIFRVKLTSEKGWYVTDNYTVTRKNSWTDGEFQISIDLDISEPQIVAYNPELHGEKYDSKWPIIEFVINSERAMYSYSYIKALMIESCSIDVEVERVKNLALYNDLGPIDISAPFYPFGSNSDIGTYFLVGCEELYRKSISALSINVHWHNLPKLKGGFKSYYKEYGQKIENDSFKIRLSGLSDYQFHPRNAEVAQQFELFNAEKKTGVLIEESTYQDIDTKKINHSPLYGDENLSEYSNSARTGFLKFELIGPEMGFGSKLFPNLFSEAAIQNAKSVSGILGQKEQAKVSLPNEAFVPQIRSISLNYKASTKLNFNSDSIADNDIDAQEKILHIHPFGSEEVFFGGKPFKEHLIGQYDQEGYLYIGLRELELPAVLSIYFELEQTNSNNYNYSEIPELTWWYLVNNDWQKLEDSNLILDSTNNFTTSGIIQIKLPTSMNKRHEIIENGLFWISVRAESNTQFLSKIVFVKTNGAKASWVATNDGSLWRENIPANTISGFENPMPEVKGVLQPFGSFAGAAAEKDDDFYFRVSERIKSKNRTVNPIDFEMYLMSNYSNIFQVKCFTHTTAPEFVRPGEVKVILVPAYNSNEFVLPRMSYNDLNRIEDNLKVISSPFSTIQVINPIYETVRISCIVQFEKTTNSGEYVKRLKLDLRKFICPWFDNQQGEMEFGGYIDRSAVFSFVDSLSYVKFVTGLSVVVLHNKNGSISLSDTAAKDGAVNRIYSSAPWCVLVPDENQDIKITNRAVHDEPQETTIDSMQVGSYFVIADDDESETKIPAFNRKKDNFFTIEFDL